MNKEEIVFCSLRYGKTKYQVEQLKKYIEEAKERLDHYQAEGNIEYIDLVKEEIEEYENEIEKLETFKGGD